MRKVFALVTAFIILTILSFSALANSNGTGNIKIYVDGNQIVPDKALVVHDSNVLAPFRDVAEACGISVNWNDKKNCINLAYGFYSATITIGSDKMPIYNSLIDELSSVQLDIAPMIIDGSSYATLSDTLEAFGASVNWDRDNNCVFVVSPAKNIIGESKQDTENKKKPDSEKENIKNTEDSQKNDEKQQSADKTESVIKGSEDSPLQYTGFREMTGHKIVEHAPHGLYGRVKATGAITLVRCRISGTEMDYTLWFNKEDNLRNYNVFTYFDKLICFSDAGVGEHTFEVYSAVDNQPQQLVFSYTYTVVSKGEENSSTVVTDKKTDSEESENTEETDDADSVKNTQTDDMTDDSSDKSPDKSSDMSSSDGESKEETTKNETDDSSDSELSGDKPDVVTSYYGFRKMTEDKIKEGAPHGLYGNVVSNYPITLVRCRIAGTEMDYTVEIPKEDNVTTYNVFTLFDNLICFSDAGLGKQKFDIFVGVDGKASKLLFSYSYTVVEKSSQIGEKPSDSSTKNNIPDSEDVCLPLEGTIKVTSPYGFRAYNRWEFHKGVDIISESLNIIAVADGTVIDCATGRNSGAGNYVAIQHEGGWVSLYYHLASYDVEKGDKVKKGDVFATMGNSGGNYGVHLHFMTCDNWYGDIWSTQNNHHKVPHEYVPQLLTEAVFYNPSYEKTNKDKMILCNFRFPTVTELGKPISISSSGGFVASENPLSVLTLSVVDKDGTVLLSETIENPKYYVNGLYTYTNISYDFDNMCELDKLPVGSHTVVVNAVSSKGRERVIYEKQFSVVSSQDFSGESTGSDSEQLSAEELAKTDAFEGEV